MSGIGPPFDTRATLPESGRVSSGELAIADPTTEFAGQAPVWNSGGVQVLPRRLALGTRSLGGTAPSALISPASSRSWLMEVIALGGTRSGPFWRGPPISAVNEGEKSSAPQLSVAKS